MVQHTSTNIAGGAGISSGTASASGGSGGKGKSRGSSFSMAYGRRPMKAYPITEGELDKLSVLNFFSTACFSLASAIFTFSLNIKFTLSLTQGLPKETTNLWEILQTAGWWISVVLALGGAILTVLRKNTLNDIKRDTTF